MKTKKRCPARAAWDGRFQCALDKGHRGTHWGPTKSFAGVFKKAILVQTGFCHGRGERCSHRS